MTARYRLPEALGGGEYEATESQLWLPDLIRLTIDGRVALFEVAMLTKVPPPLPPEPPVGSVVFVEPGWAIEPPEVAFRRYKGGWTEPGRDADAEGFEYLDWAKVCSYGTPVLLVPAPEPVALPWWSNGVEVQQTRDEVEGPGSHVHVSTKNASYGFAHLRPADAREMARGLWTAADAAEAQS